MTLSDPDALICSELSKVCENSLGIACDIS